ncbi:chorismate mutase [Paenibacillus sp. GCM10023248]|uniref:chorismate mutase n=1 Tax=Bacillales TaxID=1385 RepID=UPI0023786486|nr:MULTISPECIES: chorismate mutase [Bacillales]MDD9269023.1 chorismate mutase [Paenibacillus sp. MAHUQ-63]MDR6884978.1 chorismate mutase [Bacillus sp. 3255]
MTRLDQLRNEIDQIDQQIIKLLAQRFQCTEEVGIYKAENQLHAQDPGRESEQFRKIRQLSEESGINPAYTSEIYRRIMDIVISRHQELVVTK